jgi:hypothetical protein
VQYHRFIAGGRGIYEAVELDCPRNDRRREGKPDGGWLPRVGKKYPGAISFWTEFGLRRYLDSGLQAWHASVAKVPVEVQTVSNPTQVLYSDEFQIICLPEHVRVNNLVPAQHFITNLTTKR